MEIKKNIPLAPYTTLKIGGPARFFCEAKDEKEISEALKFARKKKIPVFVLGGGSNILVSDKGFDGVVVRIMNYELGVRNTNIECGAGALLSKIVSESVKAGLAGLEWAAGIPGTVGGAVRGNAGAFGGEMAGTIESVKALDMNDLRFKVYDSTKCGFEYRSSIFKQDTRLIIISTVLKLKKGKKEESEKRVKEIIRQRKEAQPFDFPSSGSFFKNPCLAGPLRRIEASQRAICKDKELIEEYKKDTGKEAKGKVIPAGYIIDVLGLRGKKIGGAMVSQHHGNFLVNTGTATAEDFIILAAIIKTRVRNEYGIQLQEEVQRVGF